MYVWKQEEREKRKEKNYYAFFCLVYKGKKKRRRKIYSFLLLYPHKFVSNVFKMLDKKVNSLTRKRELENGIAYVFFQELQISI